MAKRKYRIREIYDYRRGNGPAKINNTYYVVEYWVGFKWFGWWEREPFLYCDVSLAHERMNAILNPTKPKPYNIIREEEVEING